MVKALELLNQEAGLPGRGKLLPNRDDPNFKIQHRILEVATKQFVQFGYRKTSISDIADHAGIGKGLCTCTIKVSRSCSLAANSKSSESFMSNLIRSRKCLKEID